MPMDLRTKFARVSQRMAFTSSGDYWKRRYENGGTSGAGSYGPMGEWKARVIAEFVRDNGIEQVVEFGCGDGNQVALTGDAFPSYIGLDVAPAAIDMCLQRFAGDPTKSFLLFDPQRFRNNGAIMGDLVLSLDVILHLVEDRTLIDHMRAIDEAGTSWAIFVTEDGKQSPQDPHVRYRDVRDWVPLLPNWEMVKVIPNPHKEGHPSDADMFIFRRVRL